MFMLEIIIIIKIPWHGIFFVGIECENKHLTVLSKLIEQQLLNFYMHKYRSSNKYGNILLKKDNITYPARVIGGIQTIQFLCFQTISEIFSI